MGLPRPRIWLGISLRRRDDPLADTAQDHSAHASRRACPDGRGGDETKSAGQRGNLESGGCSWYQTRSQRWVPTCRFSEHSVRWRGPGVFRSSCSSRYPFDRPRRGIFLLRSGAPSRASGGCEIVYTFQWVSEKSTGLDFSQIRRGGATPSGPDRLLSPPLAVLCFGSSVVALNSIGVNTGTTSVEPPATMCTLIS